MSSSSAEGFGQAVEPRGVDDHVAGGAGHRPTAGTLNREVVQASDVEQRQAGSDVERAVFTGRAGR